MKTINETFTEDEFKQLNRTKEDRSWHDFIMLLTGYEEDTPKTELLGYDEPHNKITKELNGEKSPDAFNDNLNN